MVWRGVCAMYLECGDFGWPPVAVIKKPQAHFRWHYRESMQNYMRCGVVWYDVLQLNAQFAHLTT